MKDYKELEYCVRYDKMNNLSLKDLLDVYEQMTTRYALMDDVTSAKGRCLRDMIIKVKLYIMKNFDK